ncbi:hypothetical protein HMI56_005856 [Coelomomyces lativittatus]|nr:hypothetical protein HMI56_005856 [Coelomomyces lativittatus]
MAFISVPLYIPQKTFSRLGLYVMESLPYEEHNCIEMLTYACKYLGQQYECEVSVHKVQQELEIFPPLVPSISQYLENKTSSTSSAPSVEEEEDQVDHSAGIENVEFSIHIYGKFENALELRNVLVRISTTKFQAIIRTCSKLILTTNNMLQPFIKFFFDDLKKHIPVDIVVCGNIPPTMPYFQTFFEDHFAFEVTGDQEAVLSARIHLTNALMRISGYQIHAFELDKKYIPGILGKRHDYLRKVMASTNTIITLSNSFLPPAALPLNAWQTLPAFNAEKDQVVFFICGKDRRSIELAEGKLISRKKKLEISAITKKINLLSAPKRDWILKTQLNSLVDIMYKTAIYFEIPPLGSSNTEVKVFGENSVYMAKAIRSLSRLICKIGVVRIYLSPKRLVPQPSSPFTFLEGKKEFLYKLSGIATKQGTEIHCSKDSITIFGTYKPLHVTCYEISCLSELQAYSVNIQSETELEMEQKEFFVGKKYGKVKNIIQYAESTLNLETQGNGHLNSRNILIVLKSDAFYKALRGLELVQRELPSEFSMHVPENFHKRVIGVRGLSIQRMTSAHKVFVRFSHKEEQERLGGYEENEDNMIARTPLKFKQYLESFKKDVYQAMVSIPVPNTKDEFVDKKIPKYVWQSVMIPTQYHSILLALAPELKANYDIQLEIPLRGYGLSEVIVFGMKDCLEDLFNFLKERIFLISYIGIPASKEAVELTQEPTTYLSECYAYLQQTFNVKVALLPSAYPETLYFKFQSSQISNDQMERIFQCEVAFLDFLKEHRVPFPDPKSSRTSTLWGSSVFYSDPSELHL